MDVARPWCRRRVRTKQGRVCSVFQVSCQDHLLESASSSLVRERTFSTRTSQCGRVAHQERVFGASQLLDPTKGWRARAPRTEDAAPSNAETGGKVTACFRICTQAVIGNGEKNMDEFRDEKRNSVIERVSLACTRAVLEHQWISEFSMLMHEHDVLQRLNYGRPMNMSHESVRDSWWYIITERMS